MRRRRGTKALANYPDAKEFFRRRREFIALLSKGALGIGVVGVIGCDSASDDGWTIPGKDVQAEEPKDTWTTMGDDTRLREPDLSDTVDDARLGGLPDLPDPPETWDLSGADTGPAEPDLKDTIDTHEWDGPAGVPRMPDSKDSE